MTVELYIYLSTAEHRIATAEVRLLAMLLGGIAQLQLETCGVKFETVGTFRGMHCQRSRTTIAIDPRGKLCCFDCQVSL